MPAYGNIFFREEEYRFTVTKNFIKRMGTEDATQYRKTFSFVLYKRIDSFYDVKKFH